MQTCETCGEKYRTQDSVYIGFCCSVCYEKKGKKSCNICQYLDYVHDSDHECLGMECNNDENNPFHDKLLDLNNDLLDKFYCNYFVER